MPVSGDVYERICQLADDVDLLIRMLRLDRDALPAARLVALTRPYPSSRFRVSTAAITLVPRQILAADPTRLNFAIIPLGAQQYQFASERFSTETVGIVDAGTVSVFGLSGHVGEVWAAVAPGSTDDALTIIEQYAEAAL